MSVVAEKEAFSVRLPTALKAQAVRNAAARRLTLNAYIEALIAQDIKRTEEQQLFDAFTELGSDPEMSDVGFAMEAQAEVALRD